MDNFYSFGASKSCLVITISLASLSLIYYQLTRSKRVKNAAKVVSLFIHPIKSLQGIEVGTIEVTKNGMKYGIFRDRGMMLINSDNRMISLRQDPRLSLIQVTITGPTELKLTCDGHESIKIVPRTSMAENEEVFKFSVWSLAVEGIEVSEEVSKWFCKYLNLDGVKLVQHLDSLRMRAIKTESKNGVTIDSNYLIQYQDDDPIHLISNDTLKELNETIENDELKLVQRNFRSNIVVEGNGSHTEEEWTSITIGGKLNLTKVKLCERCAIPTIDINKGKKIDEKVQIMNDFRSAKNEFEKKNYSSFPIFGLMFKPMNQGFISIGDTVDAFH